MTPHEDAEDWIEASVAAEFPRIEIRASGVDIPPTDRRGSDANEAPEGSGGSLSSGASKRRRRYQRALSGLRRVQIAMGCAMLLSAVSGGYLLATDGSLWHLAVSHAVGLVVIVTLDLVLGLMNLFGSKRVYLATMACALLGVALQLADITTAPQYNMTMPYFARYLFGLAAFDAQLLLQASVLVFGLFGRSYAQSLSVRRQEGKELSFSRRHFMVRMAEFGTLIGLGVVLSSIKLPPPSPPRTTSSSSRGKTPGSSLPAGAIANTNNIQPGTYMTFEYPRGFPNVLFKRGDGTLAAYSLLCTHVCCELTYEASASIFFCPCHGSEYNSFGKVIRGPAYIPLPSVTLSVDTSGNIFPKGTVGTTPC